MIRQLTQAGQAEHIHFLLAAGFLHGDIFDGAEVAVSGVVHEDVDTSFGLKDGLHAGLHGGFVGDIHPDGNNAEFLQRLHPLKTPCGCIYFMTFTGKGRGSVVTDSAAGAGNKDHFHGFRFFRAQR